MKITKTAGEQQSVRGLARNKDKGWIPVPSLVSLCALVSICPSQTVLSQGQSIKVEPQGTVCSQALDALCKPCTWFSQVS